MSIRSNVQTVPRVLVSGWLKAARLPLTATERLAKQQGNAQWPPAVAFEKFEASVEAVTGSLLRDPALVEKGQLRQAKLGQLAKAAELETLAEQEKQQADAQFRQRRQQVDADRQEADRRAKQRKQELARQAELHEREVEEKAAKKVAAARQVKAAQDKAIDRHERLATTQALAAESQALNATKGALDAAETVQVIDETIEGTKAARKTR